MKTMINRSFIEGYLYEHALEEKESGPESKNPGTPYIRGTISIATNDDCTNIIKVNYNYVAEHTAKGEKDRRFTTLKDIINGKIKSVMEHGFEEAAKISVSSNLGLNEFYTDRNSKELELVSQKINSGGFINLINNFKKEEKDRGYFECDILITNVNRLDEDEEKNLSERLIVKGAIFDFRNSLLPFDFVALNPNAMNYFESLNPSAQEPVLTKIWGRQIFESVETKIVEESAFGEDSVKILTNSKKEFVITGAAKEPYLWDDTSTMTGAELKELISNREIYLADLKENREKYSKKKKTSNVSKSSNDIATGEFKF